MNACDTLSKLLRRFLVCRHTGLQAHQRLKHLKAVFDPVMGFEDKQLLLCDEPILLRNRTAQFELRHDLTSQGPQRGFLPLGQARWAWLVIKNAQSSER